MDSVVSTNGPERERSPLKEGSQVEQPAQEAHSLGAERVAQAAEPEAVVTRIGASASQDGNITEHQSNRQFGSHKIPAPIDEAAALQRWKSWSQSRKSEGASQSQPAALTFVEGDQPPSENGSPSEADEPIGTPDIAIGTPDVALETLDADDRLTCDVGNDSGNLRSTFEVCIDRSKGATLGIDIETKKDSIGWDGRSLLVKGICQVGLIADWNITNTSVAICVGDRIVEVNGVAGDIMDLMLECQAFRPLVLRVTRSFCDGGAGLGSASEDARVGFVAELQVCPQWRAAELVADMTNQCSATAVVQIARRAYEQNGWSAVWTSQALLFISRRSTKETRKVWASDHTVRWLAEGLQREVASSADTEMVLVALEALRRMGFQEPLQQRPAIEATLERLAGSQWRAPLAALCRLLWLEAPLGLPGLGPAMQELRASSRELGSSEVAILVDALHRRAARRRPVEKSDVVRVRSEKGDVQAETALVQRLLARIALEKVRSGFSAEELADTVLGFAELGCANAPAYKKLMQDILVRRGELTAGELDRAKRVLKRAGVSLDASWGAAGSIMKKQRSGGIATVQTFAPQKGHERDEESVLKGKVLDREVVRTSPERYQADRVRSSY